MRLSRLGAAFPTRLSFLRTLLRNLGAEGHSVHRGHWNISADGYGTAVYTVRLGGYAYSLVAVATELSEEHRTDRVIAEAWDAAFVLYDGVPGAKEVARIAATAPKQEAARFTEKDLVLSRANKSVRLFSHCVDRLRVGQQPDRQTVREIGYLMRTTAVYGNGKFGIADRAVIAERPGLDGPFMAEMLTVWLIRGFTHDLVEYLGGADLNRDIKRHLGIGNATGLGMAPFLVSHPLLLNNWMLVRETAFARVRAIEALSEPQQRQALGLMARASRHLNEWSVPDPTAQARIEALRSEWRILQANAPSLLRNSYPWQAFYEACADKSEQCQELGLALALEGHGDVVDGLAECMAAPFAPRLDLAMDVLTVKALIEQHFGWALETDFSTPSATRQFWYVSEEKLEPRLGDRFMDKGADQESPLDIGRRVQAFYTDLSGFEGDLSSFLFQHPEHRFALRRVQTLQQAPYAEIQDNLIGENCKPIDMLRAKLALFGATKFDPKSNLWTRITLAQGAPLADELDGADAWWLPSLDMSAA
jgi:hypothetical protein